MFAHLINSFSIINSEYFGEINKFVNTHLLKPASKNKSSIF